MNQMELKFKAKIENEPFARTVAASFISQLNPTLDEVIEIKTMVSEAVANAIIHGYEYDDSKDVFLKMSIDDGMLQIVVEDFGCGIENIELAKQPMYSSKSHLERSGMGICIIESLSDQFTIISTINEGTKVEMIKRIENKSLLECQ